MGMATFNTSFAPTLHVLVQGMRQWKSNPINQAKFLCKTETQTCISSCFIAEVPIEVS